MEAARGLAALAFTYDISARISSRYACGTDLSRLHHPAGPSVSSLGLVLSCDVSKRIFTTHQFRTTALWSKIESGSGRLAQLELAKRCEAAARAWRVFR